MKKMNQWRQGETCRYSSMKVVEKMRPYHRLQTARALKKAGGGREATTRSISLCGSRLHILQSIHGFMVQFVEAGMVGMEVKE